MYVVAGVSGHTGAATAQALLAQGKKVRVLVRSAEKGEPWRKQGCEVAVTELGDATGLAKALQGAQGFYLLSPPNFAATDFLADRSALLEKVVAAVEQAKVPAVVFLSSVGAQHPSGTGPIVGLHRAEKALEGIAPSVTFLRAAYFLENWGSVVPVAKAQGILPFFGATSVKFSQVSTKDIGAAAAKALLEPASGTRVIELTGKEDWSADDVAQALGALLGKPVKAVGAPVESARAGLEQAGVPKEMARLYAEMYQGMAKGLAAFERPKALTRGTASLAEALKPLV